MSTARVQASQDDYGKLAELICMDAEIIGRILSLLYVSSGGNKGKQGVQNSFWCPTWSQGLKFEPQWRTRQAVFKIAVEKNHNTSNVALVPWCKSAIDWGQRTLFLFYPQ